MISKEVNACCSEQLGNESGTFARIVPNATNLL